MAKSLGASWRSFWHTMTSYDRHASHDSPYRTGQHMPLNQSRHAPLTSIATSAMESRGDLNSPYPDEQQRPSSSSQNGWIGSPVGGGGPGPSPTIAPYSPGMRSSLALGRKASQEHNPHDAISPGEIQMQSFDEGLPPPPPVTHSWKRIDRWTEDNYPELYDQLAEGCTQNDINELEHELDCSLPIEVRESLQCHDGQERGGRPTGIVFGCMLLDCEEIVQEWKNWRVVNEEFLTAPSAAHANLQASMSSLSSKTFDGAGSSSTSSLAAGGVASGTNPLWRQELLDKQDSQPPRAIAKAYAHSGWIPLARDWGGNNIAVDLAPGPTGKWGQVIIFGRDYDCKYVIARSWAAFLATVADDIGGERVFVDDDSGELKLKEFKAPGVEPAYLDILRWRMDQKYGRRPPPKRKVPAKGGLGVNTANGGSTRSGPSVGSPYGSPTDERGRSPHRLSSHGTNSGSPRGTMTKSPLSQVSEETIRPIPVRPESTKLKGVMGAGQGLTVLTSMGPTTGKLVEVPTPTIGPVGPSEHDRKQKKVLLGALLGEDGEPNNHEGDKENRKIGAAGTTGIKGLGLGSGTGEMKSVAI